MYSTEQFYKSYRPMSGNQQLFQIKKILLFQLQLALGELVFVAADVHL